MGDTGIDPTQVKFTQQGPGQPPMPPNLNATAGGWMVPPQASDGVPANVPPGLEYLTYLDQILVQQVVELLEGN